MQFQRQPFDEETRREYYLRFPQRLQHWLDAGSGSCALALPEIKKVVEGALNHFEGVRYRLWESTVVSNHVHALVTPNGNHSLSQILHSWKSFTAHAILKNDEAVRLLQRSLGESSEMKVWQKESFDHIVRSPESFERFKTYIHAHNR